MRVLIAALRLAAPNAALVFVNWRNGDSKEIERVAARDGVDIVRSGEVLRALTKRGFAQRPVLWAAGGKDVIHPSATGHALLGLLAARYII